MRRATPIDLATARVCFFVIEGLMVTILLLFDLSKIIGSHVSRHICFILRMIAGRAGSTPGTSSSSGELSGGLSVKGCNQVGRIGGWENVVDKPGNRVPCTVSVSIRDVWYVRSCAREICLRCWGVFRIHGLLLLRAVAPLVSRSCFFIVFFSTFSFLKSFSCSFHFFHVFHFPRCRAQASSFSQTPRQPFGSSYRYAPVNRHP